MPPRQHDPNQPSVKPKRLHCPDCNTFGSHIKIETPTGGYWKCVDCIKREMAKQEAAREGK